MNDYDIDNPYVTRPIKAPTDFLGAVDIVVPFHGQYALVTKLLMSIFRFTRSNPYKVYLVDDGSPNSAFGMTAYENAKKNAARVKQKTVLELVRSKEQVGFGAACNLGYQAGRAPFVCFLHSDCRIEDIGWLRHLGESFLNLEKRDKKVAMVSACTNNPSGGVEAQKADRASMSEEEVVLGDDDSLSLFCFLCRRELFQEVGMLMPYPFGFFEDEEIAFRLKRHGMRQAVCRSSWVRHEGGATVKALWRSNPNTKEIMEEGNRERCLQDMRSL